MITTGSYSVHTKDKLGKSVIRKAKVTAVVPFGRGHRVSYTLMGEKYLVGLKAFEEILVNK